MRDPMTPLFDALADETLLDPLPGPARRHPRPAPRPRGELFETADGSRYRRIHPDELAEKG